jgi:hypothetical protein
MELYVLIGTSFSLSTPFFRKTILAEPRFMTTLAVMFGSDWMKQFAPENKDSEENKLKVKLSL